MHPIFDPMNKFASLIAVSCVVAGPSFADDMTIIVNRSTDAVELFFGMKGDDLKPVFGVDPNGIVAEDDHVTYEGFLTGTFDEADVFFEKIDARVAGADAGFEAMSMMLHPEDFEVRFDTPFDATIAIGVCNADTPKTPPHLSELNVYVGYYAYQVDGLDQITFQMPQTGRDVEMVSILEFVDGGLINQSEIDMEDGATIAFDAQRQGVFQRLFALR